MAILKCKMCGGNIEIVNGSTVGICNCCGTTTTLPKIDDDRLANLFNRANHFRMSGEFDKAATAYEHILEEDDSIAEAHWGAVLSKFGIEYVEDPDSHKRIPTCHRTSWDSILRDVDYLDALKYAEPNAKAVYEEEAKTIDGIQKGILSISKSEDPYDIFICYKETTDGGSRTKDSVLAQDLYDRLTQAGYRVFFSRITLEDKLGTQYEPYIFSALNSAKVMLVVGTSNDNFNAVWVKNEWSRFLQLCKKDNSKHLIPCYRDMDAYDMPEELSMLQSQDMSKIGFEQDLLRGIEKIIGSNAKNENVAAKQQNTNNGNNSTTAPLLERAFIFLEDGNWTEADKYCERVLDQEPKNAKAYLGKVLAVFQLAKVEHLAQCGNDFTIDKNWQKAVRFADANFLIELGELEKDWQQHQNALRIAKEKEQAEENQKMNEQAKERLKPLRELLKNPFCSVTISAGDFHIVGTKNDNTVLACGNNSYNQCNVSNWKDIVSVAAGVRFTTIGLKNDGTVLACGNNSHGQCNVSEWRHVTAIAAGAFHVIGLKEDGTVLACGDNSHGQCEVSDWKNIVAISAGHEKHTVGLRANGTVLTCGVNEYGQCNVSEWRDIIAIVAGWKHTVGLKTDGTVVACGCNDRGQCDVSNWREIVAIAAGQTHTVGLKSDGTVLICGSSSSYQCKVSDWRNIIAIASGAFYTVGLKADGTVVCDPNDNQHEVSEWHLFYGLSGLNAGIEKNRIAAEKHRIAEKMRQERIAAINEEKTNLNSELASLKGLFTGTRRKEIEVRLAEIDGELKKLNG